MWLNFFKAATLIGLRRERALYGEMQLKRALCFFAESN